jgi:hypothetical protein
MSSFTIATRKPAWNCGEHRISKKGKPENFQSLTLLPLNQPTQNCLPPGSMGDSGPLLVVILMRFSVFMIPK